MQTPNPEKDPPNLAVLGWRHFFLHQLDPDNLASYRPVRVLAVHRNSLRVAGDGIETAIERFSDV